MNRNMTGFLVLTGALLAASVQAQRWSKYTGRHDAKKPYDGDSFHIQTPRASYVFRIYFADAPETNLEFPDRVCEQAAYWGITESQALLIGREAKQFTEMFLQSGVTVWTKRQDARGQSQKPRYFAIVHAGESDLALELVRNGLARVYGLGADLPDGTPEKSYWSKLRQAENEARRERRGAWKLGLSPSGLFRTQRTPPRESEPKEF